MVAIKITNYPTKVLVEFPLENNKSRDKISMVKASIYGVESYPVEEFIKIVRPIGNLSLQYEWQKDGMTLKCSIDGETFTSHEDFFNALFEIL